MYQKLVGYIKVVNASPVNRLVVAIRLRETDFDGGVQGQVVTQRRLGRVGRRHQNLQKQFAGAVGDLRLSEKSSSLLIKADAYQSNQPIERPAKFAFKTARLLSTHCRAVSGLFDGHL